MKTILPSKRRVESEVERVHEFIASWFRGETERDDAQFDRRFGDRMLPGLINIQPNGRTLTRDELVESIRDAFGTNPEFQIAISDVEVRWMDDRPGHLLATYVERQTGARNTIPSSNSRISSVLFRFDATRDRLLWLHIHETSLDTSG